MEPERVTLILGAEKVDLPRGDVEQIRRRLAEGELETQGLREVLAAALSSGRARVTEAHRVNLVSALEAMHSRELRHLWEVAQNPILPTSGL